ncbi:HAD-like domain-containing protein [Xylariaceae sp. FL1272]|nr:HAD-like domain-containing protein [Xylariaceae sp. FL1272]
MRFAYDLRRCTCSFPIFVLAPCMTSRRSSMLRCLSPLCSQTINLDKHRRLLLFKRPLLAPAHPATNADAEFTTTPSTTRSHSTRARALPPVCMMDNSQFHNFGQFEYSHVPYLAQTSSVPFNPLAQQSYSTLPHHDMPPRHHDHNQQTAPINTFQQPHSAQSHGIYPESSPRPAAGIEPKPHYSKARRERGRDAIVPPSEASGGVPDPTPEYLALSSHPPFILPEPRNILVVFDLNGTLLQRPNRKRPTEFYLRPFAHEFLKYCIDHFTVAIWSSARPENVYQMANNFLTPEERSKVIAVWGRDRFGLTRSDYETRVQCYKRLTLLWDDPVVAASHPDAANGGKWSQYNTVLVDDSVEKGRAEPFNIIAIPEYDASNAEHTSVPGAVLPQVHDYLNELSLQANISAYIREKPFAYDGGFKLPEARDPSVTSSNNQMPTPSKKTRKKNKRNRASQGGNGVSKEDIKDLLCDAAKEGM